MMNRGEIKFMLAERAKGDQYWPDELGESLESIYNSLEYGDVYEEKYQIWEYPSGKIYKISPDRKVEDKYYYSPPSVDVWKPVLNEIGGDKQKVAEAYEKLANKIDKQSFVQRLRKLLGMK